MSSNVDLNVRPGFDGLITEIAQYVSSYEIKSDLALDTARNCLIDTIGCGLLALQFPACAKMLGPIVKDTKVPFGVRVPGTDYELDPIKGAFDIGCIVRWLDYNDTWLAAEWGHPSDNIGAILSICDFISQQNIADGKEPLTMRTVLESMIMAHEIQGILALENSFNKVGLDHVILVKVASTAVTTKLLGGSLDQIKDAQELGILDGVTTNPSLMAKEGITGSKNIINHYMKICEIVDGDVSAEVISVDYDGIVKEGEALASLHDQIVIKVPMIEEGVKAIRYFSDKGLKTNCTLVFSSGQALLAAKAGATYVSPFIGRLDDISTDGLDLISDIRDIYDNYAYETQILAASIRHTMHIIDCAKIGADVITSPLSAIKGLLKHPLTDSGLEKFLSDYKKGN